MHLKKCLFLISCLALCSCSIRGNSGSKTIFNVAFNMATAGNCLNGNIYNPDYGPEGFVSYKGYFSSCSVSVDYDSVVKFSCVFSDGTKISKTGTYTAGPAQAGNVLTAAYADGSNVSYYWPNYYQFYATEVFDLPSLGPTSVTVLYHAAVIFG
jgi:hypothetical protein